MEFLQTLGFDPIMLGAQILNFLIIFYLLKRFLYKPVMDMIKKRQDLVTQGLEDAEKARLTLEKTLEEEKKILTNAQDTAKKIVEGAKTQANILAAGIETNAKAQTEKLINQARAQIIKESEEIEVRLSQKVSLLAFEMLSRSLKGIFDEFNRFPMPIYLQKL